MTDRPTFEYKGQPVRAAGIMVWTRKNGHAHRLFRRIKKKFEDIGGKTDVKDGTALDTAIRECVEETHGKLFSECHTPKQCATQLRARLKNISDECIECNRISKYLLFKLEVEPSILSEPMRRFGLTEDTDWGTLHHYYEWLHSVPYQNQLHFRLRGLQL